MYYNDFANLFYRYGLDYRSVDENLILGTRYIVEQKDDLYDIAKRFHTTVNNLKSLNNLHSNLIHTGQILIVNDKYSPSKVREVYREYTVVEGDSIYSIAYLFNMTVRELKDLNNLLSDEVSVGQVLTVNNVSEIVTNSTTYTVRKGDNLYDIARKYHTTVAKLKELNDLSSNLLTIGNQLIIYTDNDSEVPLGLKLYTVLPGDNIYRIASRKNTSVKTLKKLNNLTSNILTIGEQLVVPA